MILRAAERAAPLCVICGSKEAVVAMVPCGHRCMCQEDAAVLRARNPRDLKCPICQQQMEQMLFIYDC
jgi:hypothetical protein